MQKDTSQGHFLRMKNTAYYSPYDFISNKVNAVYMVYKIRNYDGNDTEHNYLFCCGMGKHHRGICFLEDERAMRVYGADTDTGIYMDVKTFPNSGTLCML